MARIEVLLRERAGYVARGLADRVAQVDAALSAAGYQVNEEQPTGIVETASLATPENAAMAKPQRRVGRPSKTEHR